MVTDKKILIGRGTGDAYILPNMANRHGLIAGATGTGKTVTLKVMAEGFSDLGVPVFLADVKGDLAGCVKTGACSDALDARLEKLGLDTDDFRFRSFPVRFWDVFGEGGHPVRTTVSQMGAVLLARLLSLTPAQAGVLSIVFRVADDKGWLLIDLKDLRSMVAYCSEHAQELLNDYGNITKQSAGALQRALLQLEDAGGNLFFGEPDIRLTDWVKTDDEGKGYINILHCVKLFRSPLLYSTFLLWLLGALYEELPEAGDLDKPKLVFFFDEAHLLFNDAPKALVEKLEQVVKLIRSKGVGVYFITQQPNDIPNTILSQLGNRVQHALRAYTPAELKSLRAAAASFRTNPAFDTETVLSELGTGEALVSFLDEKGTPTAVERVTILPPQSSMGAIDDDRRKAEIEADELFGKYEEAVDNESAYERIAAEKAAQQKAEEDEDEEETPKSKKKKKADAANVSGGKKKESTAKKVGSAVAKATGNAITRASNSAVSAIGREIGKSIGRSLLGNLKKLF